MKVKISYPNLSLSQKSHDAQAGLHPFIHPGSGPAMQFSTVCAKFRQFGGSCECVCLS